MNKSKILPVTVMIILLACIPISTISNVDAIQQGEFSPISIWSDATLYQGDNGNVRIQLSSSCGDELEFTWVGIRFSWMEDNKYFSNVVDVKIPSNGYTEFSAINYKIDSNAPVGSSSVTIRFNFKEHHWYGWSDEKWEGSYTISIHSSYEKAYYNLNSQVGSYISDRIANSNYEGAQARASISQASTEFNLAKSLANQGSWQEALTHLTTASNLVDQASGQEQEYKAQQQQNQQQNQQQQNQQAQQAQMIQQQWYIIGAIILVVVVIVIVLSVLMIKTKNKHQV
jgi:hypothetical protein